MPKTPARTNPSDALEQRRHWRVTVEVRIDAVTPLEAAFAVLNAIIFDGDEGVSFTRVETQGYE